MEERYVLMSVITKALSPLPTYIFLNLGLHPDTVTLASLIFVILGSIAIILGYPIIGICGYLIFALLDSVDGDMARIIGPSSYGSILDSFGADLFYTCSSVSIAYYLYFQDTSVWLIKPPLLLLIGALVSLTFILYRLINAKIYNFLNNQGEKVKNYTEVAKDKIKYNSIKKIISLCRHTVVKGNFFSEAGMLFWFTLLIVLGENAILGYYLILLLLYNLGYLLTNFIGTYLFFKSLRAPGQS